MSDEYISAYAIKNRKWTDLMIRKFLGKPDKLVTNPHYSLGPKMKLYRLERVIEAENSPEFKEAFTYNRKKPLK